MNQFRAGLLLFPGLTQLDLTGPYEILARIPGAQVELIWKSREPVRSEHGMELLPTCTFADSTPLDLLCIPGGAGVNALLEDVQTLEFVRRAAASARYVTSVCTGALLLGAAGLLKGKRATTHWLSHDLLTEFGAIPVRERVVRDGNLFTAGGVTSGVDFALAIAAEVAGREAAEKIQLMVEYNPAPPFDCGSPELAPAGVLSAVRAERAGGQAKRAEIVARVKRGL